MQVYVNFFLILRYDQNDFYIKEYFLSDAKLKKTAFK